VPPPQRLRPIPGVPAALALCASLSLGGCGQKGPLYLPDRPAQTVPAPAAGAAAPTAAPAVAPTAAPAAAPTPAADAATRRRTPPVPDPSTAQ